MKAEVVHLTLRRFVHLGILYRYSASSPYLGAIGERNRGGRRQWRRRDWLGGVEGSRKCSSKSSVWSFDGNTSTAKWGTLPKTKTDCPRNTNISDSVEQLGLSTCTKRYIHFWTCFDPFVNVQVDWSGGLWHVIHRGSLACMSTDTFSCTFWHSQDLEKAKDWNDAANIDTLDEEAERDFHERYGLDGDGFPITAIQKTRQHLDQPRAQSVGDASPARPQRNGEFEFFSLKMSKDTPAEFYFCVPVFSFK